jgi:hypothetical protein
LKALLTALALAAAFTVPAQAADEWLNDLSLKAPTLAIENRTATMAQAKATLIVTNNGTADSKEIRVNCVFFDDRENTVGEDAAFIARIKPGKMGYGEASMYLSTGYPAMIECKIEARHTMEEVIEKLLQ